MWVFVFASAMLFREKQQPYCNHNFFGGIFRYGTHTLTRLSPGKILYFTHTHVYIHSMVYWLHICIVWLVLFNCAMKLERKYISWMSYGLHVGFFPSSLFFDMCHLKIFMGRFSSSYSSPFSFVFPFSSLSLLLSFVSLLLYEKCTDAMSKETIQHTSYYKKTHAKKNINKAVSWTPKTKQKQKQQYKNTEEKESVKTRSSISHMQRQKTIVA